METKNNFQNRLSKLTTLILTILAISNLLVSIRIINDRTFFNSLDFMAYSIGARTILDGRGKDLYNIELQREYWKKINNLNQDPKLFLPFIAPATTALIYIPFNVGVEGVFGYKISLLVNALFIIFGVYLLAKALGVKNPKILIITSGAFMPTWVCLWQAQPTSLMFFLIALSIITNKSKEGLSIFLLISSLLIKPHYAFVALPIIFILNKNKKLVIRAFLISGLLFYTVNVALTNNINFIGYIKFLIKTDNPDYGNRWYEMYTIQSLLISFFNLVKGDIISHLTSKKLAITISGFIYLAFLFYLKKLRSRFQFDAYKKTCVILQTCLFFSYHVLAQDLILALFFVNSLLLNTGSHLDIILNKLTIINIIIFVYFTITKPTAPIYGVLLYLLILDYLKGFSIRTKVVNKLSRLLK